MRRPCGSRIVVITPAGLCTTRYAVCSIGVIGVPLTSTLSPGATIVPKFAHDFAVDAHLAVRDELIGTPPRSHARLRNIFVQPRPVTHVGIEPRHSRILAASVFARAIVRAHEHRTRVALMAGSGPYEDTERQLQDEMIVTADVAARCG